MIIRDLIYYVPLILFLSACGVGDTPLPLPAGDQDQLSLPPVMPVLGETSIIEVGEDFTTVRSRIQQLGRKEIFQHGHFWEEEGGTAVKIFSSTLGKRLNSGSYTSELLNLNPQTTYKVWPYVETVVGSVEGEAITFTTN